MEILQYPIEKIGTDLSSEFELRVWNVLYPMLKRLDKSAVSKESSIDKGLGIEVYLREKEGEFILHLSLTKDDYVVNSKYFDIYIYPETETSKIELLSREVLLGNYKVFLCYNNKGRLKYNKIEFKSNELILFNETKKRWFMGEISKEIVIDGIRFIQY